MAEEPKKVETEGAQEGRVLALSGLCCLTIKTDAKDKRKCMQINCKGKEGTHMFS